MKTAHEPWTERRASGSEQLPEFLGAHADDRQDVPQSALGDIASGMNRDDDRPAIEMAQHVMASADSRDRESGPLQRPDHLSPPERPEGTRVSGHVEGQRQLIWRTDLREQRFQRIAQVGNRSFRCRPVTYCPDARAQLCGGAPDAVLILHDDVRHMDHAGHNANSLVPTSAARIAALVAPGSAEPSPTGADGMVAFQRHANLTGSASRACRSRPPGNGDWHLPSAGHPVTRNCHFLSNVCTNNLEHQHRI